MTTNDKLIQINEKEFKYEQDFNAFSYINGTWNKVVINLFNKLIQKFQEIISIHYLKIMKQKKNQKFNVV